MKLSGVGNRVGDERVAGWRQVTPTRMKPLKTPGTRVVPAHPQ
jgi:hypothetical protein